MTGLLTHANITDTLIHATIHTCSRCHTQEGITHYAELNIALATLDTFVFVSLIAIIWRCALLHVTLHVAATALKKAADKAR